MNFYKDGSGIYYLDDKVVPKHSATMETMESDTTVVFKTLEGEQLTPTIEVVNIEKEDGSTYADLAELLTANADFFS